MLFQEYTEDGFYSFYQPNMINMELLETRILKMQEELDTFLINPPNTNQEIVKKNTSQVKLSFFKACLFEIKNDSIRYEGTQKIYQIKLEKYYKRQNMN